MGTLTLKTKALQDILKESAVTFFFFSILILTSFSFQKFYDYNLDTKFFIVDLIKYAATPPNEPQRCILTDYFNNYNFSKLK